MPIDTYILFLFFIIYSMVGWVSEVVYCYIENKVWVNRGFMHGPYCPIYGFGALICIFLLSPYTHNPFLLFIMAVILTSALEYMTSLVLEKLFHTRLWDYSDKTFNLQGRVCLQNSLLFGIGGLAVIYILHPLVDKAIQAIPAQWIDLTAIMIAAVFFTDLLTSVLVVVDLNRHLGRIEATLAEIGKWPLLKINELEQQGEWPKVAEARSNLERLQQRLKEIRETPKWYHKRFLKAYPTLRSIKYPELLIDLRKRFNLFKEEINQNLKENHYKRHIK